MSETKDYSAFLRDLNALVSKHGLVIGGCGCCGSPWVVDAPENPEDGFYRFGTRLEFIHPSDEYDWEKYGDEKP